MLHILRLLLKRTNNPVDAESLAAAFENHRFGKAKHEKLLLELLSTLEKHSIFMEQFSKLYDQGPNHAFYITLKSVFDLHFKDTLSNKDHQTKTKQNNLNRNDKRNTAEKSSQEIKPIYSISAVKNMDKIEGFENKYFKNLWNFKEIIIQNFFIKSMNALPIPSQEFEVIKELLHLMVGVDGDLIVPKIIDEKKYAVEFSLSSDLHESLKDLIADLLPLPKFYALIQKFVQDFSKPEKGQVLQALSAVLREILLDYYVSIAQLEALHNQQMLNLSKLSFYTRPIVRLMQKLASLCAQIYDKSLSGANVLSLLHEQVVGNSGDESTQKIFLHLTQLSSVPYMEMLKLWTLNGKHYIFISHLFEGP